MHLFSGNPFEIFSFMGLTYYQIALTIDEISLLTLRSMYNSLAATGVTTVIQCTPQDATLFGEPSRDVPGWFHWMRRIESNYHRSAYEADVLPLNYPAFGASPAT